MTELHSVTFRTKKYEITLEASDRDFIHEQEEKLKKLKVATEAWVNDEPLQTKPTKAHLNGQSGNKETASRGKMSSKTAKERGRERTKKEEPSRIGSETSDTPVPSQSPAKKSRRRRKRIVAQVGARANAKAPEEGVEDFKKLLKVVQRIKKSSHFKAIETKILRESNQINRILLSSYFGESIFRQEGLTTGEIESITKALGVPLRQTNISAQMKRYSALYTIDGTGVPRRGIVVHYRLNQQGRKKFETLLQTG